MTPSPCINLCQMDDSTGLCRGCYRTIDEITAWSRADEARRQAILALVAQRRHCSPSSTHSATQPSRS